MAKSSKNLLKKCFSYKIYTWITVLLLLILTGIYGYGYFSGKATTKNNDLQASIMVKKLEKVQELVFLNVGVQKIEPKSTKTEKLLGIEIPNKKKVILILNYDIKLGIKSAVKITKTGEKAYQIQLPKYDVIGINLDNKKPYELYDESGEILSFFTEKIDTGKVATDALKDTKKQRTYIKRFKDLINQSAENYYKTLFEAIDDEIDVEVIFPN